MYFSFILLAEPLTHEGGEETGVPGEIPDNELHKMPYKYSLKIQAPIDAQTHSLALMAG